MSRIAALDEIDYRLTEGIIHNGIELIAKEITPFNSVAFLVGSVLPDLTDNDFIFAEAFDRLAKIVQELVGKLVGNIKTLSCCAFAEPVLQNSVLSTNEVSIMLVVFPDIRKSIYSPPSLVGIGKIDESVPIVIFAVLRLVCACFGIASEFVEINAVGTGMRENAVKNYGYTVLFSLPAKLFKLIVSTKQRIGFHIISSIVSVIFMGLKDRVKVKML